MHIYIPYHIIPFHYITYHIYIIICIYIYITPYIAIHPELCWVLDVFLVPATALFSQVFDLQSFRLDFHGGSLHDGRPWHATVRL